MFYFYGVKRLLVLLTLLARLMPAQTIEDCRQRYLNFLRLHPALDQRLQFSDHSIRLKSAAGKTELVIYESELKWLGPYLEQASYEDQRGFWERKGSQELSGKDFNSADVSDASAPSDKQPLKGKRIAIDPGHFAVTLKEAAYEQKYLYFKANRSGFPFDSVKIFESKLSFNTALLVKAQLEELGAEVMLTRDAGNHCSFGCSYSEWLQNHKKACLDSLVNAGKMNPATRTKLLKANPYTFFWDFFRDFDLQHRAALINRFMPDICLIIHYNVDEKNAPWKSFSEKNFTMAFIGGAYVASNLNSREMQTHFLRQLCSGQLNRSADLSALTVQQFHKRLGIPIATRQDADYLHDKSVYTGRAGVFSRNLLLCRQVNAVLVYGEALYQDNLQEAAALMQWNKESAGIETSARLMQVAEAYVEALKQFLIKRP